MHDYIQACWSPNFYPRHTAFAGCLQAGMLTSRHCAGSSYLLAAVVVLHSYSLTYARIRGGKERAQRQLFMNLFITSFAATVMNNALFVVYLNEAILLVPPIKPRQKHRSTRRKPCTRPPDHYCYDRLLSVERSSGTRFCRFYARFPFSGAGVDSFFIFPVLAQPKDDSEFYTRLIARFGLMSDVMKSALLARRSLRRDRAFY